MQSRLSPFTDWFEYVVGLLPLFPRMKLHMLPDVSLELRARYADPSSTEKFYFISTIFQDEDGNVVLGVCTEDIQ